VKVLKEVIFHSFTINYVKEREGKKEKSIVKFTAITVGIRKINFSHIMRNE